MRIYTETAMRLLLRIFLSGVFCACAGAGAGPMDPGIEEVELNGTLIPKEMYSAYKDLDHMLSPAIKKEMAEGSEDALAKHHAELGGWIRDNWGGRRNSDLSRWFHARGIDDPDDISALILKSYRRYLRDEPLGLDTMVKDETQK